MNLSRPMTTCQKLMVRKMFVWKTLLRHMSNWKIRTEKILWFIDVTNHDSRLFLEFNTKNRIREMIQSKKLQKLLISLHYFLILHESHTIFQFKVNWLFSRKGSIFSKWNQKKFLKSIAINQQVDYLYFFFYPLRKI